jgi:DNA-binding NarL/FixJ family response regulator
MRRGIIVNLPATQTATAAAGRLTAARGDRAPGTADPFVGRRDELGIFEQMVRQFGDGMARVVEVIGEPGIGKTRMLAEARRCAAGHGVAAFTGQAREPERRRPFGPLVDALDDPLAALDVDHPINGLSRSSLTLLATVFPALAVKAPLPGRPGEAGPPPDLHHLYRAMREPLRALARPALVLALDDIHHADEESVELIAQLLRRPIAIPLLLVLAYRPRQTSVRLRAALAGTAWAHERLHLGPLAERDMERLLGGRGTAGWRRALYRESLGNPFYLKALSSSEPQLSAPGAGCAAGELPPAVEAALLAEIDTLTGAAQLLARSGAVIGETFAPALAAGIAELDRARARAAIDELAARDLVRPVPGSHELTFRHALVHRVVYESANPGWCLGAHARAAAVLELDGHSAVARAHHVERIAGPGDLAAVEVLAEAAETVRCQAPATAARWLGAALRLIPAADPPSPRKLDLMLRLGTALGVSGHPQASRDVLHEVLRWLPDDPHGRRAEAVAFCALMERLLRRPAEANALLDREICALAPPGSRHLAMLEVERASGELIVGGSGPSRDLARRALATARAHRALGLQAAALGLEATGACIQGDVPDAEKCLDEAAALLDGLLDDELAERLDAAAWVGWSELLLERPHDALRHFDRALARARARGQLLALPHPLIARTLALHSLGRLREATSCAEDAVDLAQLSGSGEQRAGALTLYRWTRIWTGELSDTAQTTYRPAEPGRNAPGDWFETLLLFIWAEYRLESGDAESCLAAAQATGLPDLDRVDPWSRVAWYELLTRAELSARRVEEAQSWADRASRCADLLALPGRRGLALLAHAQAAAGHSPAAALEPAQAALGALQQAGMVTDALRARLLVGAALGARGETDRAAAELTTVQKACEAQGALPLARRALEARRRLDTGSVPARRSMPDTASDTAIAALTGRERQVAALVSDGLTNRQIAQRLFLAEKTVETHLSHIFAKLGVSSRTAVAGTLLRAATAQPVVLDST